MNIPSSFAYTFILCCVIYAKLRLLCYIIKEVTIDTLRFWLYLFHFLSETSSIEKGI